MFCVQEHAKRTAEKDASDAVKEAKDSAERTALAAKRVAELELKAASDPKTIAENERLRRELDRRTDARFGTFTFKTYSSPHGQYYNDN